MKQLRFEYLRKLAVRLQDLPLIAVSQLELRKLIADLRDIGSCLMLPIRLEAVCSERVGVCLVI